MKQKTFRLLLVISVWLTLLLAMSTTAVATGTTEWYDQNTEATEFTIKNVAELEGLASLVNGGNNFKGKTIKLADDFNNTENPLETPIGTEDTHFQGTFDGNGKTVNLNISGVDYAGLFAYVGENGTIQNVSTCGTVSTSNNITTYAGGVVGCNTGGTVTNCYATGTVSSTRYAGGVVAANAGTVTNCYATGTVSASGGRHTYAGGVVANNRDGTVTNCYATGNVSANTSSSKYSSYAGGVVGVNFLTVTNCYATGAVSANGDGTNYAGGVAGYNGDNVSNCYATGAVSASGNGTKYAGGVVGENDSDDGTVSNCYCTDATIINSGTVRNCDTFDASQKLTNGKILVDALNEYATKNPSCFKWEVIGNNTPTFVVPDTSWYNDTAKEFTIENVKQLEGLASLVNGGNSFEGKTIKLANDFNNTGKPLTTPIGTEEAPFEGTFDGNGKTVNLNISGVDYAGLFGGVGENGTVQNVSTSGTVSGTECSGGVVGANAGTVTNCYATGALSASSSADIYAGGVVGFNLGTVTNCYATGTVSVSGGDSTYAGGVVGWNFGGTVTNCYHAEGTVSASSVNSASAGGVVGLNYSNVTNCYATGAVSASGGDSTYAGGVVGWNFGTVTNCYCYDTNTNIIGHNDNGTVTDCDTFNASQKLTISGKSLVDALNEYVSQNPTVKKIKLFKWEVVGNNTPTFLIPDTSWYNATATEFTIENVKQLEGLASLVNGGNSFEGKTIKLSDDFKNTENPLTTPIGTMNNPFSGTFDGNNKTVELNISGVDCAGLFGCVWENGTVQNVSTWGTVSGNDSAGGVVSTNFGTVSNCYATGAVSASGGENIFAGGVVGGNGGTVTNCYATGAVSASDGDFAYAGGVVGANDGGTVTNCYATGTVSASGNGTKYAGGVVGANLSTVTNCYATGAVSASGGENIFAGGVVGANLDTVTNCYATGAVSVSDGDSTYASGVVAWNLGTVTNCYATGTVSASGGDFVGAGGVVGANYNTVVNCYATGAVSASTSSSSYSSYAGGVVGINEATVTNCYATGAVSATGNNSYAGGVVGLNYRDSDISVSCTVTNCYCYDTNTNIIGHNDNGTVTNCDTFNASQKLTISGKSLVDVLNEYVDANPTATPALSQWTKGSKGYPVFGTPTPKTTNVISVSMYVVSTRDTEHGSVSVTDSSYADKTVTITVHAEAGYQLDTLTVTDANGNEIALKTVQLGESYTFVMPRSQVTVSASFVAEPSFVDVKENDFFYNAVLWAVKKGITTGVDATHFAPTAITTRAQMVTFLWRASGSPEPTATTCVFTDVNADSYYAKAVMWGYENGYVKGVSATRFAPDATVTRGQTVALLARMNGVKDEAASATHGFVDVFATNYYNNAVAWAVSQKITNGISENIFAPNDACTRGQIVTFLYRNFVK